MEKYLKKYNKICQKASYKTLFNEKHFYKNKQEDERREKMKIENTMTIGELLEVAPEKAEILLNVGMHCLGCPASQGETIEEACMVHGIDVEELIQVLNQ